MKPEKSGTPSDAEERVLRIDPRSDRGLEHLHGGADEVKEQDDFRLVEGLEAEVQHPGLHGERRKEEEVVARQGGIARIDQIGRDDEAHHDAAEQAGPRLLHAEAEEFVDEGSRAPLAGPMAELSLHRNEARERRPDRCRAGARLAGILHVKHSASEEFRRGGLDLCAGAKARKKA
jgi:hypothetical protein